MAFQTGSIGSASALRDTIEAFAVANGWTLGSGVLSNGDSFVKLDVVSANAHYLLTVQGATSSDFYGTQNTGQPGIYIEDWTGATYWLFASATPCLIWCAVKHGTDWYQWLGFGDAKKHGTWAGGNWYGASRWYFAGLTTGHLTDPPQVGMSFYGNYGAGCALFADYSSTGSIANAYLHCDIEGGPWSANPSNTPGHVAHLSSKGGAFSTAGYWLARQPNLWNGQSMLVPFWLHMDRPDGMVSLVAEIPGLRSLRIDNYNPGEIVTVGADQWMCFPWQQKDAAHPGGNGPLSPTSGCIGYAVAYDGP